MNDLLQTYWNRCIGRSNDFAQQRANGGYWRMGRSLTLDDLDNHLRGQWTIGTYVINEKGQCRFAVFDADSDDGLQVLRRVQTTLAQQAIPSYLERSRRGGHLWASLCNPYQPHKCGCGSCPFARLVWNSTPKQERAGPRFLIRLPLGVHLRSGKRYPFVEWRDRSPVPVARTVSETLAWLETVQCAEYVALQPAQPCAPRTQETSFSSTRHTTMPTSPLTIRDWCAGQDPYRVIGAYVDLNSQGIGQCPFSWHHAHGDTSPSFKVYTPGRAGGYCWYCYTWEQGGSIFTSYAIGTTLNHARCGNAFRPEMRLIKTLSTSYPHLFHRKGAIHEKTG